MTPELWAVSYLTFVLLVVGFFAWLLWRAPDEPFMDPAIREDREVAALDAIWDLPSFDPREMA